MCGRFSVSMGTHLCRRLRTSSMDSSLYVLESIEHRYRRRPWGSRPDIHSGGEGGIRTLGPLTWSTVFETAPFDHSGTSPKILDRAYATEDPSFIVRSPRKGNGGEGGIRTLGRVSPTHAFQACTFSHSVTSPIRCNLLKDPHGSARPIRLPTASQGRKEVLEQLAAGFFHHSLADLKAVVQSRILS